MGHNHRQRLARLEEQASAEEEEIVIRVVYEASLGWPETALPWHVRIQNGVSRVVYAEEEP